MEIYCVYACRLLLSPANAPNGRRAVSGTYRLYRAAWSDVVNDRLDDLNAGACHLTSVGYSQGLRVAIMNFFQRLNRLGLVEGTYGETLVDTQSLGSCWETT